MISEGTDSMLWTLYGWSIPAILGFLLGLLGSYLMHFVERREQRLSLALALAECVRFEIRLARLTKEQVNTGKFLYSNDMLHNPSLFYDLRPNVSILEKKIIAQVIAFNAALKQYDCTRDNLRGSQEKTSDGFKIPLDLVKSYDVSIGILISTGEKLLQYLEENYPKTKFHKQNDQIGANM